MITMYKDALVLNGDNLRPFIKGNSGKIRETYYSPERNNLILFQPCDKEIDTDSIINCTTKDAFEYLMDKLENERNIVVKWYQVEGTTSDWEIYYGLKVENMDVHNFNKCLRVLKQAQPNPSPYKHTIIKDGIATPMPLSGGIH